MKIAIYGRKSIFSDKSDSVDNQHRMCQDYIHLHFPDATSDFYQDEDYTGANTNRPGLKNLLSHIENYNALIVYQLDRLSRSVKDFSEIYSILEQKNISFISLKEQIDTTTPIGRAMMYVTVVFAQMERETISQRVSDNMIGLAKKGFWTGGFPPRGYVRKKVLVDGREHCTIAIDPEGMDETKRIITYFAAHKGLSLTSYETYLKNNNILTHNGKFFSSTQLHRILTTPIYVKATTRMYDYFENLGCQMGTPRDQWDGKHGIIVYGRTTSQKGKHELQSKDKWLVCVGMHEPFIDDQVFLLIQDRLKQNIYEKTPKHEIALLKGVLRCKCGCLMSVRHAYYTAKSGKRTHTTYYGCTKAERQGKKYCDTSQIKTEYLDNQVLDILRRIPADEGVLKMLAPKTPNLPDIAAINKQIGKLQGRIAKLSKSLEYAENSSAYKYIIKDIETIDEQITELNRQKLEYDALAREMNLSKETEEERLEKIKEYADALETMTAEQKNKLVRYTFSTIVWNGTELKITF